jgi:hypothetical protein
VLPVNDNVQETYTIQAFPTHGKTGQDHFVILSYDIFFPEMKFVRLFTVF